MSNPLEIPGTPGEHPPAPAPRNAIDWLAWIGGAISAVIILVILAITSAGVFGRYIMGAPIRGIEEATGYLVVAAMAFGAADALRRGDHIGIDIVTAHASSRTRYLLGRFGLLCVTVFAGTLAWTAWHTVSFAYGFGMYSPGALEMPMWIPISALIPGGILLALMAIALFVRKEPRA